MHPVLTVLEWHGVTRTIGSYGALLALALLVGSAVTLRTAQRAGLDVGAMISALAGAVGSGFVAAYLTTFLVTYARTGALDVSLARPGITFYGGVIGGALGLAGFARVFGLSPLRALDVALPGLPIAHAIGRIGCFLGGCCYGRPSTHAWAVLYRDALAPGAHPMLSRHPWPLYEAVCLLLLAALFAAPLRFAAFAGRRAASYVLCYAILRVWLEPLRGDSERGLFLHASCSVSQLIAVATGAAALGFLRYAKRGASASPLCARSLQV